MLKEYKAIIIIVTQCMKDYALCWFDMVYVKP